MLNKLFIIHKRFIKLFTLFIKERTCHIQNIEDPNFQSQNLNWINVAFEKPILYLCSSHFAVSCWKFWREFAGFTVKSLKFMLLILLRNSYLHHSIIQQSQSRPSHMPGVMVRTFIFCVPRAQLEQSTPIN